MSLSAMKLNAISNNIESKREAIRNLLTFPIRKALLEEVFKPENAVLNVSSGYPSVEVESINITIPFVEELFPYDDPIIEKEMGKIFSNISSSLSGTRIEIDREQGTINCYKHFGYKPLVLGYNCWYSNMFTRSEYDECMIPFLDSWIDIIDKNLYRIATTKKEKSFIIESDYNSYTPFPLYIKTHYENLGFRVKEEKCSMRQRTTISFDI